MARSVPTVSYQFSGSLVTAELWNNHVKYLGDFMANRPTFRGINTAYNNALNNTWTPVFFDTSLVDTDGGHNTIVNNSRYTCQVPGWYWVMGCIYWYGGVASYTRSDASLAVNGNTVAGSGTFQEWGNNQRAGFNSTALLHLNAGDYVEMWGRQQTGGTVAFMNNSFDNANCNLSLWFVSN